MANLVLDQRTFDQSIFAGKSQDAFVLIEVPSRGASRRIIVTEQLVQKYIENDFQDLTTKNATTPREYENESLKFFYSVRSGHYDGSFTPFTPLPMHADLFERVAPFARIPEIWSNILIHNTAMQVYATPQLPLSSSAPSYRVSPDEYLCFIIQSIPGAVGGICASASYTYHFKTRHMYVFMHGFQHSAYSSFVEGIEQGTAKPTPLLIPSLLVQSNLETRLRVANEMHQLITDEEKKLGIIPDHHEAVNIVEMNYEKLTQNLNAATTNLAYMAWACKTTTRQLDFLDGVAERYRSLAVLNGEDEDAAVRIKNILLDNQAYLRCWNTSLEERAEYLAKRGQALVQTVYSGIAQRDAALSQNAAIASARDSTVMRVIAAITIFFLPATTVATFFSTTFFNFNVGRHERVYSWWLWLYWVVTLALTAVVLVGAISWWKKKENEMAQRIRKGKVEKPVANGETTYGP